MKAKFLGFNRAGIDRLLTGGGKRTGLAGWLGLAAMPTFAIMGLVSGVSNGGQMMMCGGPAMTASPLGGMAVMYLLMSVFHATPWLRMISGKGSPSGSGAVSR